MVLLSVILRRTPFVILFFHAFLQHFEAKAQIRNAAVIKSRIIFKASEFQQFGFDEYLHSEKDKEYDTLDMPYLPGYRISYKSVGYNFTDDVDAVFSNKRNFEADSIEFKIEDTERLIRKIRKNDSTFTLLLPKMTYNYRIEARYKGILYGKLNVVVYSLKTEKLVVVPLIDSKISRDSLQIKLNTIFRQANLQLNVAVRPVFTSKNFPKDLLFDNPGAQYDHYTDQMRELRDAYFSTYPNADKNAYYVFLIPGFVEPEWEGFMVENKAVAFFKYQDGEKFYTTLARTLSRGIGILHDPWLYKGPKRGTTQNLMDVQGGILLSHRQWEDLRHSSHSYSYFDNYEDVRTNSGIVAYYFWQEDKNGNIILDGNDLLKTIRRPYKKNFMSYHLNINELFFQPLFNLLGYMICAWHLLAFTVVMGGFYLIRRNFHKFLSSKVRKAAFWKFMSRIGFFLTACGISFLTFLLINQGYERFEVRGGRLKDLGNQSTTQAVKTILVNQNIKHKAEDDLASEILIKKGKRWYVKKRKKVLYFDLKQDEHGNWTRCRYKGDSDSLILKVHDHHAEAESHYFVFNYTDSADQYVRQVVFNHLGIDLTDKLKLEDPSKRILIMVNGYRPTSIGHSFEENFKDVQSNGLEYPNSSNMVYPFDRYDYWRPWQQIDLLFKRRINPTEMYYADGHFSVTTSNHQTLLNFSTVSTIYPKRCKNKNKHTCYTTTVTSSGMFGSKVTKTIDLHRTRPNKKGFKERRENGRIAAHNLLLLFNESPNRSENDTLYIVAHSMGYAYALGIMDELRGKIHFGGFYILAPENASAGKVDLNEWQEVWQYGSNFNKGMNDAPCLLDGVAPQAKVGGITEKHRAYIPEQFYKRKGFFDSHFVGFYTWVFNIPEGNIGYIRQR